MKRMLKLDLMRVIVMTLLSFLATLYVSFVSKDTRLLVITKSFMFVIPILMYLRNREYIKDKGVTITLEKESVIISITLILYVLITIFSNYRFDDGYYHVGDLVDLFVLLSEFLVLGIMLFIKKLYRKIDFVLLLVLATIMFVMISKVPKYSFIIYIFYGIIDLGLSVELVILGKKYEHDKYLKK